MTRPTQYTWTFFSISLLVTGAFWIWYTTVYFSRDIQQVIPAPHKGFLAPDFTAKFLDGEEFLLSNLQGKPILLNIWASWCSPCRREMPALEQVYRLYHEQGFTILAVNATNQDQIDKVTEFVHELDLSFPVLLDENGRVIQVYQVEAFPTSFFISPDGIIQDVVIGGPMTEALLRSRVENLLRQRR